MFWAVPLGVLLLLTAGILALPGFVSSDYHRNTIEALASSLTGRDVHISGPLSLALLPQPRLTASNITIFGPDHETITAQSLTLDVAPGALLRGHLSARSITLQSPQIALPWPLPGGAAAVAPPLWLAALHAQIINGRISLGALTFQHVSADIFTGAGGALAVSGTGNLANQSVALSLSLGGMGPTGAAPLTIDATYSGAILHLSGSFNTAGEVNGAVTLKVKAVAATAALQADAAQITLTNLQASEGKARLAGAVTLDIAQPALNATLTGSDLTIPALHSALLNNLPVQVTLAAKNTIIAGLTVPQLTLTAGLTAAGIMQVTAEAAMAGNTSLDASGATDATGLWRGKLRVSSTGLNPLLAALGSAAALPEDWQTATLTASFSGRPEALRLEQMTGKIGPAHVTGALLFTGNARIYGALHFDQLDVTPLLTALRGPPPASAMTADVEITADRAGLNGVAMTHLLVDAALRDRLVIRRLTASSYGGLAAGSFTIAPGGQITAARALLSVPSAAPLAALLPAAWQPPKAITAPPLAFSALAAGPPTSLSISATLTLGDFTITAAPTLDLVHQTAAGAFTLRHPSAIAAFKAFGLASGLPWPGAGSIALRADMVVSPTQMGMPDFVLSMGDLTATGKILAAGDGTMNGEIDADTLALPPWPDDVTPLWGALAAAKGKISLSANRVLVAGAEVLSASAAGLTLQPDSVAFDISHAALGGGALTGSITATTAANAPPGLAAKFSITGADLAGFNLPVAFPITLPSGTFAAQGNLTATGYNAKAWAATVAGAASLTATAGSLAGFDLSAMTSALGKTPRGVALTKASLGGATPFSLCTVAGNFGNGIYTISAARLQSPAGNAAATGNIDVPDQDVALTLSLFPNVPSPPKLGLAMVGSWAAPKKIPAVRAGVLWKAPP